MNQRHKYILLFIALVGLIFIFTLIANIAAPYRELAKLPRCENTDIVLTQEFRSSLVNFADEIIKKGTGDIYFKAHFQYFSIEEHLRDCIFEVKYEYVYGTLHEQMTVTLKALDSDTLETVDVYSFLRPVTISVTAQEAEAMAAAQNVSYDYYNREIDVPDQIIVYRFYKDTLSEGRIIVLEIDAQSQEVLGTKKVQEFIPIV